MATIVARNANQAIVAPIVGLEESALAGVWSHTAGFLLALWQEDFFVLNLLYKEIVNFVLSELCLGV
jgi:hypothetical protein